MSRGPGRVERAIQAASDAEPDKAFTVEDLCLRTYPGLNRIEKKHRVAVIRAMRAAARRADRFGTMEARSAGGTLILYRRHSVFSYAMARLKSSDRCSPLGFSYGNADPRARPRMSLDEQERALRATIGPGGKYHSWLQEGGCWWREVQVEIAERDGDTETAGRLKGEIERDFQAWLAVAKSMASLT